MNSTEFKPYGAKSIVGASSIFRLLSTLLAAGRSRIVFTVVLVRRKLSSAGCTLPSEVQ